ncbi:MAG TPA: HAMP domain-containing sensor histidine kinase [Streptosporangiaceae bacterium]|jgi:signal transduction histidine kinase|nr:HAMP domain-containing sensor histidine kinase [Streptosporangiaceae bacterium]
MRARLTLLYGGMFLLAGGVLIGIFYAIFTSNFPGGHLADGLRAPNGTTPRLRPDQPVTFRSGIQLSPADVQAIRQRLDEHRSRILRSLVWESLLALAVVAVAAVAFGWLMAGRALRSVRHITDTARRVAGSNLHERIALDGPRDELKELADTFDAMLERLDASFDGQRRFVANASHELRTPLATNRTLLEVAVAQHRVPAELRQVIDTVLAVNAHSELVIDGLLALARSESQAIDRVPVDLSDVAAGAVEETAGEAAAAGITVDAAPDPAPATGDPILLERLALNLVRNGIRHNHPGGWVTVSTRLAGPGLVELVVANSGPPVPPQQVETLFEPFRRLGDSRTGHPQGAGLGLSIVRSVVQTHGGYLTASARDGGGLIVRVCLTASTSCPAGSYPAGSYLAGWGPAGHTPRFPEPLRTFRIKSLPRFYAALFQERPTEPDFQLRCGPHQESAGRILVGMTHTEMHPCSGQARISHR